MYQVKQETMQKNEYIEYDFNLPNHVNELNNAENMIEKYQKELKNLQNLGTVNNHDYLALYEKVINILDYVGMLSLPAFNIEDKLEDLYTNKYIHFPELAKKLWLDHYKTIHRPYNILKNRCYSLLDDLDELYINVHKKTPPNWDY